MSEGQQVSSLPLPPLQYIGLYSEENIRRNRSPRPPPLIHDSYVMFGQTFNYDDLIIRPLESQGLKRLYPQNFDHKRELKKLNHSILVNFLDVLDIFIRAPDSSKREEKIEDLNLLFIHIHHLINEFRPHQARETLRVMMEMQKQQRLETAERFQKHFDRVLEKLQTALSMPQESAEWDCKLLVPTEAMILSDMPKGDSSTKDTCTCADKLMCEIIDAI